VSLAASLADHLHSQALEISARYQKAEAELVEILQRVEEHRVFLKRGHASLFSYVTRELGLSESAAYSLITVARKAREVPALKAQLRSGAMTLSNARRVASVLTSENQGEWIQKACELSNRQLEKEIVKVRPQEVVQERTTYVTPTRVRLELGLSETEMLKLRRVQDLLSQSKKRPVTLEEVIAGLTSEFLNRHDPVEKAKRHRVKKGAPQIAKVTEAAESHPSKPVDQLVTLRVLEKRVPIPRAVFHQVAWRDQRRCTHTLPDGSRCQQARWVEVHHKVPVSRGGPNTLDNLTTLCSAHHRFSHQGRDTTHSAPTQTENH
jgi:5-methylcytosine-specific restriction endonuclease McrA